jgi:hypothetical protein
MLTERAQRYLALLKRVRPAPAEVVERAFREQGEPCPDVWLDFQERFAGYVEPLGQETAVWGIIHEKSQWTPPCAVWIENWYENGETSRARCADVHGSYDYWLGDGGIFHRPLAETFEIKVERNAARATFMGDPNRPPKWCFALADEAFLDRVHRETSLVPEASDKHRRILTGDTLFAEEDVETGRIVSALTRAPRR